MGRRRNEAGIFSVRLPRRAGYEKFGEEIRFCFLNNVTGRKNIANSSHLW